MTSSLQPVVEQPLRFSTGAFQAVESATESRTAVLLREVTLPEVKGPATRATVMAVAMEHGDTGGADRALDRFQKAVAEGTQPDVAARLKSAFRAVNRDLHDHQAGEISMVAMVAQDKYASFAAVGDNQAILYRANRINQVTRNQRSERPSNRRSTRHDVDTAETSHLLGAQAKLDSSLPAIFDITLLPMDAIALLSGHIAGQLTQGTTTSALVAPGQTFGTVIEQQLQTHADPESAAVVLEVLPVREALVQPPEAVATTPNYLPYIIIVLALIAGLLFVLWQFFV